MKNPDRSFSAAELAHVDMLIAVAIEKGLGLDEKLKSLDKDAYIVCDAHQHKGPLVSDHDILIFEKISSLYEELEWAPTLDELITMRSDMTRTHVGQR